LVDSAKALNNNTRAAERKLTTVLGWTFNYRGLEPELVDETLLRIGRVAIWVGVLMLPFAYYRGVIARSSVTGLVETLSVVLFIAAFLFVVHVAPRRWRFALLVVTLFICGISIGLVDPKPGVGTEYVAVAAVLMVAVQGFKAGFTVLLAYGGLCLAMIHLLGFTSPSDSLELLIHALILLGLCLGAAMTGSYLSHQLKRSSDRRDQLNHLVDEQNRLALALTSRVENEITAIAGLVDSAESNRENRARLRELAGELQQSIATLVGLTHVGRSSGASDAPSVSAGPDSGDVPGYTDPLAMLSGRRVLLIDDDAMVRRATEVFLKGQLGVQVESCSNAQQALLDIGKGKHFDLIITDSVMPKISGAEFTAQVRRFNTTIPIIAATGSSTEQTVAELKQAGADAVLTKPLTREALLDSLKTTRKRRDFGW